MARSAGIEDDLPPRLSRTIQSEIIPRLMLALRTAGNDGSIAETGYVPSARDVRELVRLVLDEDASVALTFIAVLRARGAGLAEIYLDLLQPTAARLGYLWEQDERDFTAVTAAMARLNQVLQACSPGYSLVEADESVCGQRVLLLPVPGEQHTFGVHMVSDFLRALGLDVWVDPLDTEEELADLVARKSFAIVGFSMSAERHLERLRGCVASVRSKSRNPDVRILVGGNLFIGRPELVREVGADGTAADGREVAALVQEHVLQAG
ncbi:MAG: cobalamin B12-binding domain-containing protein [Pseudomonadota bacterium]